MDFILGSIILSAALYVALNWQSLRQRGSSRFGAASSSTPHTPSRLEDFFRRRAAQRASATAFPAPSPPRPSLKTKLPSHQANIFETNFCDLCRSLPQVQYRSKQTQAVFEFCNAHAVAQHGALSAQNFTITVDIR